MQNQVVEVKPIPDERIDYIDFLRVIALFMVVMIHVSAFYFFGEAVSSKTWMVAHFYDSLSRPAVPIFIMVSGMLLLSSNRPSTLSSFLRNRSFRVSSQINKNYQEEYDLL